MFYYIKSYITSFMAPIQAIILPRRFKESGLNIEESHNWGKKSATFFGCFSAMALIIINNNGFEASCPFLYMSNSIDICFFVNAYKNKLNQKTKLKIHRRILLKDDVRNVIVQNNCKVVYSSTEVNHNVYSSNCTE